jgi:hypothetical protein
MITAVALGGWIGIGAGVLVLGGVAWLIKSGMAPTRHGFIHRRTDATAYWIAVSLFAIAGAIVTVLGVRAL